MRAFWRLPGGQTSVALAPCTNSSGNSSSVVVSWGLLGSLEFHDGVLGTVSEVAVSLSLEGVHYIQA